MITAEAVRQTITKEIILARQCTRIKPYIAVTYCKLNDKNKTQDEKAQAILQIVSEVTHLPISSIVGKRRLKEYVDARRIAQWLIYNYTQLGLKKTGLYFGGAHWSSIIHAKDTLMDLIEKEPDYKQIFQTCERLVASKYKKCIIKE